MGSRLTEKKYICRHVIRHGNLSFQRQANGKAKRRFEQPHRFGVSCQTLSLGEADITQFHVSLAKALCNPLGRAVLVAAATFSLSLSLFFICFLSLCSTRPHCEKLK